MNRILPLGILLFIFWSCRNHSNQSETTEILSDTSVRDTICFRQVVARDTTTLRLIVNGSEVTGELAILPYEKDRARGLIRGVLTNNQIRADWQRSGEGVSQPYEITFTLTGDTISWREGERVKKQGKWIVKEPENGFEYKLFKTECW